MSTTEQEGVDPLPPPTPPAGAGDPQALLRTLPPVNEVLEGVGESHLAQAPREEWVEEIRQSLSDLRARVLSGHIGPVVLEKQKKPEALLAAALRRIERKRDPGCVRVVNATGVVLHTNIGRASMPPSVLEALQEHGRGYQLLAADAMGGERSGRERHVERLFQQLTGCEAATVVNNNAAATMIALAAVAEGREVVVARGQLVEIGGAYRIPEVMEQSGAILHEVGTTNRVHLRDYENAINENTACLMRVHTSNYEVQGFTGEVSIEDMVGLAKQYGIPVVDDLGSGALVSLKDQGVPGEEPLISESIKAGVDLITASGDKLIGGPQMGIMVGTREMIARVRRHPLYRAIRCDKLTLIAMEATLRCFLHPEKLKETHPTYAMLTADKGVLEARAKALADRLGEFDAEVAAVPGNDTVGAGSLPTVQIPGAVVRIKSQQMEAGELAQNMRLYNPPVFTTVHDHAVHIHVRTLQPGDEEDVVRAVEHALAE